MIRCCHDIGTRSRCKNESTYFYHHSEGYWRGEYFSMCEKHRFIVSPDYTVSFHEIHQEEYIVHEIMAS